MPIQLMSLEEMKTKIGSELGVTDWFAMDQERINKFADCTLDNQWIHLDEKAAAKGPFGKTIAHGYLSVSLLSYFAADLLPIPDNAVMAINYGMNKLRLLSPVLSDAQIRDRVVLMDVQEKSNGRILITAAHTLEIKGQDKPALYAEALSMFYTA